MKNKEIDIMARTIYGEARGELAKYGTASLIAIGNVIFNRYKKHFAKSIENVCLAPHQFSCRNKSDPNYSKIISANEKNDIFRKCIEIATNIIDEKYPDITDGCDHYHACYVKPYWAANIRPKHIFGSHYFYKLSK